MKNQITLSSKQQELAFQQIFKLSYNQYCADCQSKSPTWASIDFGVFICYNCSGIHRMLGQNITRIRSTKLDCWTETNINIMKQFGNQINNYWEYNLPKEQKINQDFTLEQIKDFIYKKYIEKLWVNNDEIEPKLRINKVDKIKSISLIYQSDQKTIKQNKQDSLSIKNNQNKESQSQQKLQLYKQFAKTTEFEFDPNNFNNYQIEEQNKNQLNNDIQLQNMRNQLYRQILYYQTSEKYHNNPFVKDLINEQKQLLQSRTYK